MPDDDLAAAITAAAAAFEGGRRTAWALGLLHRLCAPFGGDPAALPACPRLLRAAVEATLAGLSPQMRVKGLRVLRRMLLGCTGARLEGCLPRYARNCPSGPPLLRQRRVLLHASLPRGCAGSWIGDFLQRLLTSPRRSSVWHTTASAQQALHMVHRFLRCQGWTAGDFATADAFEHHVVSRLGAVGARAHVHHFVETACSSAAAARRYLPVFNLLFHEYFGLWAEPCRGRDLPHRAPRVLNEDEINAELSAHTQAADSADDDGTTAVHNGEDNFDPVEVDRLLATARHLGPCEDCVLHLLLSTGLRRQAVLNILVTDVAERQRDDDGRLTYSVRSSGVTLSKGRVRHSFPLDAPPVRAAVARWLNTSEGEGGRPASPSPFLLPSGQFDNGHMSPTSLRRLFRRVCSAAGFEIQRQAPGYDRRTHLHATRHTYAHELMEAGNPLSVVAAALHHRDTKTTSRYLRESEGKALQRLQRPTRWCQG